MAERRKNRPGYKTTEFHTFLITVFLASFMLWHGKIDEVVWAGVAAPAALGYMGSRIVTKTKRI